jgi:hypothetical protein
VVGDIAVVAVVDLRYVLVAAVVEFLKIFVMLCEVGMIFEAIEFVEDVDEDAFIFEMLEVVGTIVIDVGVVLAADVVVTCRVVSTFGFAVEFFVVIGDVERILFVGFIF